MYRYLCKCTFLELLLRLPVCSTVCIFVDSIRILTFFEEVLFFILCVCKIYAMEYILIMDYGQ